MSDAALRSASAGAGPAADDLESARERAEGLLDSLVGTLPRLGIALGIVLVAWLLSRAVGALLRRRWERSRTASFARVMPRLVAWSVIAGGVLLAVTITFPSIDPVDVVAGLGVVSIAAGFAFQDIFSNLLSGLLLITRQPFVSGDQVRVGEVEGTVHGITIRETAVDTFDGRRVLVPNRDVYQNAISIQTAHPTVRSELVVGCSYRDDLESAARTALAAVRAVPGVSEDPGPVARFREFAESGIDLELRWWSGSRQDDVVEVRHRVLMAVRAAFRDAGLEIPWPIRTLEASDSLRAALGARPGERAGGDGGGPDGASGQLSAGG